MKILKVLLMLTALLALVCGCKARGTGTVSSVPPAVSSLPEVASKIEGKVENFESRLEDGISEWEDNLFGSEEETSLPMHGSEPAVSGMSSEESIAAAMSTDFKEIGALSPALVEWGSGGPTDSSGRPNGCIAYQEKYGKYGAYFLAPASKKVYLTFDEGYENGYTAEILDTLKAKNAKAVFFITYPYAQEEQDLVRRMIDEGHVLGNHSSKHKTYPSFTLQEAAEDVMTLHNYVKKTYGYEMSLFRFPEGKFSEQTLALLQSLGYKSLFWSFAYMDYDVQNQPLTIEALDKITSKCHPGAIYLLHAVSKTNTEVLGEAIDKIRSDGYTLTRWDIY